MNWNTRFISHRLSAVALLSVSLATQALAQQVPLPYSSNGTNERPCSNERFMLEVPLGATPFLSGFETTFASELVISPSWFCGGLGCPPASEYRARLTPTLPVRRTGVPPERLDGHRRSFIVTFEQNHKGAWFRTTPNASARCEVVKQLRAAAAKGQGIKVPTSPATADVLVSRSCNVRVQDAEYYAAPSTLAWADERIKARPGSVTRDVDVALVDTGVPVAEWWNLGVANEKPLPAYEPPTDGYHAHGAHMAALIRSVAPNAKITSYRALDEYGVGSLAALASATDEALFQHDWLKRTGPLVVNLSVGAPPNLFIPSNLSAGSCSTWEDPSGEAMRYVLQVAGVLDEKGPAVFVAAASGNQPFEKYAQNDLMGAQSRTATRCGVTTSALTSSFFPAALGELQSCSATTPTWLRVQPVGASNWNDSAALITLQSAQVRLYAPGERVYARGHFHTADSEVSCTDVGSAVGFELPAAVTGTSAATALVSATAAHVLGRVPWAGQIDMPRAAEISRLLYLTGQPMCLGPKARRIDLSRADDAVQTLTPGCIELVDCLSSSSHPAGPAIGDSTGYVCAGAMQRCFGVTGGELGCPPVPPREPGWSSGQLAAVARAEPSCRRSWGAPAGLPTPPLLGQYSRYTEQQLAGIGPQPSGDVCPVCSLIIDPVLTRVRFELGDEFPLGTQFQNVSVALFTPDKQPVAHLPISDGRVWRPGEVGEMVVDLTGVRGADPTTLVNMLRDRQLIPVLDVGVRPRRGEESRMQKELLVELP